MVFPKKSRSGHPGKSAFLGIERRAYRQGAELIAGRQVATIAVALPEIHFQPLKLSHLDTDRAEIVGYDRFGRGAQIKASLHPDRIERNRQIEDVFNGRECG